MDDVVQHNPAICWEQDCFHDFHFGNVEINYIYDEKQSYVLIIVRRTL